MPSWWGRSEAHIAFLWVLSTLSVRYIDVISHGCRLTSLSLNYSFYHWISDRHTRGAIVGSPLQKWLLLQQLEVLIWSLKTFLRLWGGWGVRGILRKLRGLNRGKDRWKTGYPYCSSPAFTECLYALVLYEKTNYGTFQSLHKKWTRWVYQVLGSHKKRINPRVGAEKSQGTWSLPAGKKLKQLVK